MLGFRKIEKAEDLVARFVSEGPRLSRMLKTINAFFSFFFQFQTLNVLLILSFIKSVLVGLQTLSWA